MRRQKVLVGLKSMRRAAQIAIYFGYAGAEFSRAYTRSQKRKHWGWDCTQCRTTIGALSIGKQAKSSRLLEETKRKQIMPLFLFFGHFLLSSLPILGYVYIVWNVIGAGDVWHLRLMFTLYTSDVSMKARPIRATRFPSDLKKKGSSDGENKNNLGFRD